MCPASPFVALRGTPPHVAEIIFKIQAPSFIEYPRIEFQGFVERQVSPFGVLSLKLPWDLQLKACKLRLGRVRMHGDPPHNRAQNGHLRPRLHPR